jgi:SAM-dependent methyltransferase
MHSHFPLFRSHLDLAHQYWEKLLQAGDWAIDATCGNGHDTLKLAEILKNKNGGVIGIDIQPEAIEKTQHLLGEYDVELYCQSHADFPLLAKEKPVRLIVYNLGYLPGGNKAVTTMAESTLTSVRKASALIVPGGAVSITCYQGHAEGAKEQQALLQELAEWPREVWNICHHTFPHRLLAPSLFLIQKSVVII